MPKLIVTCGLSGSGKSTYAESLVKTGFAEINRDKVRFLLYTNGVEDWSLYKFTKEREAAVTEFCDIEFKTWVNLGANIIISNTHLTKGNSKNSRDIPYWEVKAKEVGYDFEVKYFPITLEEAYKRDMRRGGKAVGRDVLNRQWKDWLKITNRKTYNPTDRDRVKKNHVILCDIDGTIAKMGDRGPFDWKKVGLDHPRDHVLSLVNMISSDWTCDVIFLSGRDSVCRQETLDWLEKQLSWKLMRRGIKLIMRKEGDPRKDSIIKEEFFWEIVKDHYVKLVIDDRPQVIRMWKDLGLKVIDVSEGYDEF